MVLSSISLIISHVEHFWYACWPLYILFGKVSITIFRLFFNHLRKRHLFLVALDLHCCMQAFSSCSEQGLLSSCSARASHCSGLSCWAAWALEHMGLVASWHVGSFLTRDQTCVPCTVRRTLNHWTIMEALFAFLMLSSMSCLYMLDINPLLVILFVNNFSHSVSYLFVLLMGSFAVWKVLSLIRSHLCFLTFPLL